MHPLVSKSLELALAQEGQRELPGNRGEVVRRNMRITGLGEGNSWCAGFVVTAEEDAAHALGMHSILPNTASCDALLQFGKEHGLVRSTPAPGDVFLRMAAGSTWDARHTGFVTKVPGNGRFGTIEGNTNDNGSAEGIGVFQLTRPVNSTYKFLRWADLLPAIPSPTPVQAVYKVLIGDNPTALLAPVMAGVAMPSVPEWAKRLGLKDRWDQFDQALYLSGKEFVGDIRTLFGEVHAPVRQLADFSGLKMTVDTDRRLIKVFREE